MCIVLCNMMLVSDDVKMVLQTQEASISARQHSTGMQGLRQKMQEIGLHTQQNEKRSSWQVIQIKIRAVESRKSNHPGNRKQVHEHQNERRDHTRKLRDWQQNEKRESWKEIQRFALAAECGKSILRSVPKRNLTVSDQPHDSPQCPYSIHPMVKNMQHPSCSHEIFGHLHDDITNCIQKSEHSKRLHYLCQCTLFAQLQLTKTPSIYGPSR